MALDFGHNCGQTELKCFDCRKPICRKCMIELPKSLICRHCHHKKSAVKYAGKDLLKLEASSMFYSFVLFSVFSWVDSVGAGGLNWLFAALAGVHLSESLNNLGGGGMGRKGQLAIVIFGILLGAVLGCGTRAIVLGKWDTAIFSVLSSAVSLVIVIIAIFVRFRKR